MWLEIQNEEPIAFPRRHVVRQSLRRLKPYRDPSYASLITKDGSFIQVGGGKSTCMMELRDMTQGRHYRAWLTKPVVPFPDGTELSFAGTTIALYRNEFLFISQVVDAFLAFMYQQPFSSKLQWRDITEFYQEEEFFQEQEYSNLADTQAMDVSQHTTQGRYRN